MIWTMQKAPRLFYLYAAILPARLLATRPDRLFVIFLRSFCAAYFPAPAVAVAAAAAPAAAFVHKVAERKVRKL